MKNENDWLVSIVVGYFQFFALLALFAGTVLSFGLLPVAAQLLLDPDDVDLGGW